jgi:hypothetical protein
MWSWIKRKFVACKDAVLNPINRKLSRDWELLSLTYVDHFIENMGVLHVLMFYATVVAGCVGGLFVATNAFPMVAVWLGYFTLCIGLPNFLILLGLVGVSKYISNYKRRHGWDAVFWTGRRTEKVGDVLVRLMAYTLALYVIILAVMAVGHFAPVIFVGEFMYFVSALGAWAYGELFLYGAWSVAFIPWVNMFFQIFKLRIDTAERIAMMNRERPSTNRGSMVDWADEDDILDCRLERLGL